MENKESNSVREKGQRWRGESDGGREPTAGVLKELKMRERKEERHELGVKRREI